MAVKHVLLSKIRLRLNNRHAAFDTEGMLHFHSLFMLVISPWMFDTFQTKWGTKIFLCNFIAVKALAFFKLFSLWHLYLTIKVQTSSKIILNNFHWYCSAAISLSWSSGLCSSLGVWMLQKSWLGLCGIIFLSVAMFVT